MDVKAVANTQASIEMNSQANSIEQSKEVKKEQYQKELDKQKEIKMEDIPEDILKKAADNLQKKLSMLNSSELKIETDKETGIQVVKIIDQETKEVVKQLPPETILKIAKYIDEITGLLFEKKA